jgi:hypothetical protein
VVRAEVVDRQQPARQWTGSVAMTWEPQHTRNNGRAVFSVRRTCREDRRVSVVQLESVVVDQN